MPEVRVAMLTGFAPRVGGAERQAERLARALIDRGARVRVITPRESDTLPERDEVNRIPVHRVAYPRVRGIGVAVLLARIFADLLRGDDDVIHVHIPGPMLVPAVLTGSIRRMPVVLKFANFSPERGIWVEVPAGFARRWAIERAARHVHGIVAISSRIASMAGDAGWSQVARIPNGIDLDALSGKSISRAQASCSLGVEGDPIVLFVGRLHRQKGVDVLLEAWAGFVKQRPRARLLILGDGPEASDLRREADTLGIAPSVEFRGSRKDVGLHYAAAQIFVLPSRYEGFPNVMLEAMVAGCPVIASCVSGTEDAIENGRNGLLVPPGESEPLLEALLQLSHDGDLADRLGREARKTVAARYDINRVAELTIAFYRRLLGWR